MFCKYLMLLSLPAVLLLKMYKISQIVRNDRLLNTRTNNTCTTLQHLYHKFYFKHPHTTTFEPHYNTCTTNVTANLQWEIRCTPTLRILVLLYLGRAKFSVIVIAFDNIGSAVQWLAKQDATF